jgi:hypothetical protein
MKVRKIHLHHLLLHSKVIFQKLITEGILYSTASFCCVASAAMIPPTFCHSFPSKPILTHAPVVIPLRLGLYKLNGVELTII